MQFFYRPKHGLPVAFGLREHERFARLQLQRPVAVTFAPQSDGTLPHALIAGPLVSGAMPASAFLCYLYAHAMAP